MTILYLEKDEFMGYIFNKESRNQLRRKLRNESPQAEKLLWLKIRRKQLHGYKFRRQYGIGPYVIDFYCPKLKLAIEVDGGSHFTEESERYDRRRENYIKKFGIKLLRFTNTDIYENLKWILDDICREILNTA